MEGEVTQWLRQLREGHPGAVDRLVPLLYSELRTLARQRLRGERAGHTLSTTGLVHEAYVKLQSQRRIGAADRSQFLAVAANTMRRLLIDHARTRTRRKRGGDRERVPLESVESFLSEEEAEEMLELDEALTRLEAENAVGALIVQQRFFAGLTAAETAELLGLSTKSVQRKWVAARAWLRKELRRAADAEGGES